MYAEYMYFYLQFVCDTIHMYMYVDCITGWSFEHTCTDEEIVTLTEIFFCGGCGVEVGIVCYSDDAQGFLSQIAYDGDL